MRKILDAVYGWSGAIAALFLFVIFALTIGQVLCNVLNRTSEFFLGESLGLTVPSYADFSGYFLAATTAFALAYTFNRGAHIRVNLIIRNLSARNRHLAELVSTFFAAILILYVSYYMLEMTVESFKFGDVSTGTVAIKTWIPQASMFAGFLVLSISLLDAFFTLVRGGRAYYLEHDNDYPGRE